ncbi:MAG: eukaryotic-like serine/threonine-protein kinase [Streptomyces sp.]|nr:eukaryotic-like serine/threonine-protein kinase [Streptomyces sp.]
MNPVGPDGTPYAGGPSQGSSYQGSPYQDASYADQSYANPPYQDASYADPSYTYEAPTQALPSYVLSGRYQLSQLLGRGGMADVYFAHDTRLGRTVAVKTLRADLAHDPASQGRFRREAQSAASLNHPSIGAVYDTGEDWIDGVSLPYIVMEYVDGSTLADLLNSGRKLLPTAALEMTVGILQALEYSHRSGIVHRDIKPANVMLTREGQVKVMDFGIARAMDDASMAMTQTGMVVGTAQYLSPEQALGRQVDARSDLYSTGCLLYELLAVRPPFTGESPVAVAYQHVQEEPLPPSVYDPGLAPEIDAIVLRALAKDPNYRYQSADDMRADIEAYLDGRAVAAATGVSGGATANLAAAEDPSAGGYGQPPEDQGQPKSKKSAVLLGVAAAVVIAGAVLMGWILFGGNGTDTGKVAVPILVGQTLDDAKNQVDNAGLLVTVTKSAPCADQPKDRVCSQTPDSGQVAKGATISVVMSTGAPKVAVPDVTDQNESDATTTLEDKGFAVQTKQVVSNKDPGTVLDQNPKAGTKSEKGSTVTLKVAKAADKVTVPDLTGLTPSEAKTLLESNNLVLGSTTDVDSSSKEGTVVGQSILANKDVKTGTTIDVDVAKAAATVQVPSNLIGMTLTDARTALNNVGLKVALASGSSADSNALVTASNPTPGSDADSGSTVTITTSPPSGGSSSATPSASAG